MLPEELLEFAKSSRFVRVFKLIWDALSPASRGRRICYPFGSSADPIKTKTGGFDLRGFIRHKSEKRRRRSEKRISGARFGGTSVLPEELLEFAKSKEFVRVCNESATPCPLGVPPTLLFKTWGV